MKISRAKLMTKRITDIVNPTKRPTKREAVKLVNRIALVVDVSDSMASKGLMLRLTQLLNEQIDAIKQAAYASGQITYVSVYTFADRVECLVRDAFPESVQRFTQLHSAGWTALYDGVRAATLDMEAADADAVGEPASFLVLVLTDGEENYSCLWDARTFRDELCIRQAGGRWSFAFSVPQGGRRELEKRGVPAGNIQEWDQTVQELGRVSDVNVRAIGSYTATRSAGRTSTQSLYADLADVTKKDLRQLDDLSGKFRRWKVTSEEPIADLVRRKAGAYTIGRAYYQLTKTEAIQDHKKIVIEDQRDKKLYGGQQARDLLGLASGPGVTVKVTPGNLANFKVFVNSTSMNRKLVRGTELLYER